MTKAYFADLNIWTRFTVINWARCNIDSKGYKWTKGDSVCILCPVHYRN